MSTHSVGRRAAVKAGCKPVHFSLDGCPLSCYFSGSVATTSGHFVHKSERRTRDGGFHIPPCLLLKPDLRLRLHATQAQPCFPAASNCALALPGGNGIFTATPTERITHYTLLRKVVCQMGALPPLETPTRKGGTLPLHGAHTAVCCQQPVSRSVFALCKVWRSVRRRTGSPPPTHRSGRGSSR